MAFFHVAALLAVALCGTSAFLFNNNPQRYSANGETPADWRLFAKKTILKKAAQTTPVGVAKNVVLFLGDSMGIPTITATRNLNVPSPADWRLFAKKNILKKAAQRPPVGVAKNVMLFLGDGMSIPTITATRILKGQLMNHTGEESVLSYDTFPYTGLSKTYAQDHQVTDSAASGTAYLCGVKTNQGLIGLDASAKYENCSTESAAKLTSILDWSMAAGKSVGIVTTTRITHATPACLYANSASRWWEGDHDTNGIACKDIAAQLIDDYKNVQVILGGGRRVFMRYDQRDPEHGSNSQYGRRDGRDLIQEWQQGQHLLGRNYHYVWKESDFRNVNPATTDSLMGLFESSHMNFDYERNDPSHEVAGEPSLEEMTEKAIQILSKNPNGFFLLVEGGKIDLAHHAGQAKLALYDSLAFEKAVAKGDELTSDSDTLIVVTADHSHTMTIVGYPSRGNPIFGKVDDGTGHMATANDHYPYTTLMYADGPGAVITNGHRPDISHTDTSNKDYLQQAAVPTSTEHHGGDDVAIYAKGPMSHVLGGVHEQHEIAHAMAYASCVGDYTNKADCAASLVN